MTTFLIIYVVGIIINAFAAASIRDDLAEDKVLERIRFAVLLFFILLSFGTWVYFICYFIVQAFKKLFTTKRKEESHDGSGSN